ncbi:MAG: glycoside hydrolase family 43 protein [Tepidisphaeraceae bacterium]
MVIDYVKTSLKLLPLLALALGRTCLADNPIIQTLYTADPAPLVYHDRVYLYTGHDEDKSTWFTMKDWRCFSSTDMVNWTDHGSPLAVTSFDWARSDAWAGQVIERAGKFYYYVPMNRKGGGMSIGVAVADNPTGPFKDAIGKPLISAGWGNIDPTVYIDDDGQAYLYWGNPQLKYVKLNRDMISYDEKVGVVDVALTPEGFGKREKKKGDPRASLYEEGPWFYRRGNLYYMVYAAGGIPEFIAYATSTGPTGPWQYRGVIMPTEGKSFTNHPGVIDYKGHSYFFYHNGALPGGGGFTRSVCVESFDYNPDGTFPKITMTKDGPAPLGHLNPYERTEAETFCWESGIKTQADAKGGMYVTSIDTGDYLKIKSVDFGQRASQEFTARVAAQGKAAIEVCIDAPDAPPAAVLHISPTGGGDQWQTLTTPLPGLKGVHDIYLRFTTDAGAQLKFDWWQCR